MASGDADPFQWEFRNAFTWRAIPATEHERQQLDLLRVKILTAARRAIVDGLASSLPDEQLVNQIVVYSYASRRLLPTYATLSATHSRQINDVINAIVGYEQDRSLGRPLNFLLIASPGSGKSQLVRSIAQQIAKEAPVDLASFNMATMQTKDDLGRVIDAARNMAVDRKLPLIFLDEFDSRDAHYPFLLPLLWDGELDVLNRDLRLGRSVFFLAGSRPSLPVRLNNAREMFDAKECGKDDDKLVDLFSRINGGVIEVPSLDSSDAIADKVVIAMQLLRHRFANCERVPRSLLWFLGNVKFRYESRSIAAAVNLMRVPDAQTLVALTSEQMSTLPFHSGKQLRESPLAFHLVDRDRVDGLMDLWTDAQKREGDQPIRHPLLDEVPLDSDAWITAAILHLSPQIFPESGTLDA